MEAQGGKKPDYGDLLELGNKRGSKAKQQESDTQQNSSKVAPNSCIKSIVHEFEIHSGWHKVGNEDVSVLYSQSPPRGELLTATDTKDLSHRLGVLALKA